MLKAEFFIGQEILNPTDVYSLTIDLMHGDADAYSSFELQFEKSEEQELTVILGILREIGKVRWERDYHNIEGFYELLRNDWQGDSTCDGEYLASYNGHSLVYFNNDGKKFEVVPSLYEI